MDTNNFDWISIYIKKPAEGQVVTSRPKGQQGYASNTVYTDGYFQSLEDHGNRVIITRWKHDEWMPQPNKLSHRE